MQKYKKYIDSDEWEFVPYPKNMPVMQKGGNKSKDPKEFVKWYDDEAQYKKALQNRSDSSNLYKKTKDIENPKHYNGLPPSWYNVVDGFRTNAFARRNNIDYDYEYYRTGKFPGKIQPIATKDWGEGMAYPIYRKPVVIPKLKEQPEKVLSNRQRIVANPTLSQQVPIAGFTGTNPQPLQIPIQQSLPQSNTPTSAVEQKAWHHAGAFGPVWTQNGQPLTPEDIENLKIRKFSKGGIAKTSQQLMDGLKKKLKEGTITTLKSPSFVFLTTTPVFKHGGLKKYQDAGYVFPKPPQDGYIDPNLVPPKGIAPETLEEMKKRQEAQRQKEMDAYFKRLNRDPVTDDLTKAYNEKPKYTMQNQFGFNPLGSLLGSTLSGIGQMVANNAEKTKQGNNRIQQNDPYVDVTNQYGYSQGVNKGYFKKGGMFTEEDEIDFFELFDEDIKPKEETKEKTDSSEEEYAERIRKKKDRYKKGMDIVNEDYSSSRQYKNNKDVEVRKSPINQTYKGNDISEMFYDPIGLNYNNKRGFKNTPLGGHSNHGHFASQNSETMSKAKILAKSLGLNVTEDGEEDAKIDPVHSKNSYHYKKLNGNARAAMDITGQPNKIKQFFQEIQNFKEGGTYEVTPIQAMQLKAMGYNIKNL